MSEGIIDEVFENSKVCHNSFFGDSKKQYMSGGLTSKFSGVEDFLNETAETGRLLSLLYCSGVFYSEACLWDIGMQDYFLLVGENFLQEERDA